MQAGAVSAEELRRLIALLESRGLAGRPDARALLDRSRRLLAAIPEPRPAPSAALAAGKLRTLALLLLDALAAAAFAVSLALGAAGMGEGPALAALLLPGAWAALRISPGLDALYEAWLWAVYQARWGQDWFAEAFSARAARRIEARITARRLWRGWRARQAMPPDTLAPTLADVRDFLGQAYGAHVSQAFAERAMLALGRRDTAGAWTLRGGGAERRSPRSFAARLQKLRRSALIEEFGWLATSGALWSAPRPTPPPPTPPSEPEPPPEHDDESPERARPREALQELIRRKKRDIHTAHGWKLKTEAEAAHRDAFQAELRREIAEHEAELAAVGIRRARGAGGAAPL